MRRVLGCLLLVAACKKRPRIDDAPVPPPEPAAETSPDRPHGLTDPDDVLRDAWMLQDSTPIDPTEPRLRGYAKLLAIDFWIYQVVEAFPVPPAGTTFVTHEYEWRAGDEKTLLAVASEVDGILASTAATPAIAADASVAAYTKELAAWLPQLASLHGYYERLGFVDDEFDRARREAPELARTAAVLATLRTQMRADVYAAWDALVRDRPAAPRTVIGHAWQACMTVADRIMQHAKEDAVGKAVSDCRRSVTSISELGRSASFAAPVKKAAIGLGNWVAQGHPAWNPAPSIALRELTDTYFDLWPTLPVTPAEKP